MYKLKPNSLKLLKSIHLVFAGVWLSGVLIMAFMPLLARGIESGDELFMYNLIYYFIDMAFVTVAAILTLLTGLTYSLFTKWGFFKHGWLIYKWITTVLIIVTGTFYLGPMTKKLLNLSDTLRIGALEDSYYMYGQTVGIWAAIINSILLVLAVIFSIYKPWKNIKR